jgi:resuscitation-promoting factor RpfB
LNSLCYTGRVRRSSRFFLLAFLCVSACSTASKHVIILFDGERRVADTEASTVRQLLQEQDIPFSDDDHIDPPLYAEVGRSATITVTRVEIKTATERLTIPFTRKFVRDEFYPDGKLRLIQLGANGTAEVTYAIIIESGQETGRRETARKTITPPKDEILAIGTQGSLANVSVIGTVAYIANGNAWVMRQSNTSKRPLTSTSDLDGRIFSLSADSRYLLFSRAADESSNALNTLWLVDTALLDEPPRPVAINDVLYAQLAPDARSIVYSTAEKTAGAPGWKAHNDLWLATDITSTQPIRQQYWKASIPSAFGWWGGNFSLSPDGQALAYAFADEVGLVDLSYKANADAPSRRPLKKFPPFTTRADWVWVPKLTWSPDNLFIMTTLHAPLDNPNLANESPEFQVWAFSRDGTVAAPLARQTGMWSEPVWSGWDDKRESRIAFGVALSPTDSERSRYALYAMDRDGGNKKQIFPQASDNGLTVVQTAWSPNTRQLIAVRDGDLWLYDFASSRWSQLTANNAGALPRWGR